MRREMSDGFAIKPITAACDLADYNFAQEEFDAIEKTPEKI